MLIRIPPSWRITENEITPESVYLGFGSERRLDRRRVLIGGAATLGAALLPWQIAAAAGTAPPLPAATNLPVDQRPISIKTRGVYKVTDRATTDEKIASSYNNYYEFSLDKAEVATKVKDWKINDWKVEVKGLCQKPKTWDIEDLIKAFDVEERIYRHRCVEAWSMVIPWNGIPLEKLIKASEPKSSAKYVKFVSYNNSKVAPNISALGGSYPWPYTEGLMIEEAMNPLTMLATGFYGKRLARQNGAPVRLVTPWKYGFKGAKSIVEIEFTDKQPSTLWNQLANSEYGFYANVNPEVSHPRWSQASERVVDGGWIPKRIPTLKFNGYEKEVAHLYKGLDLKKFY